MNEHQLSNIALVTFFVGFFLLGYVVLFVPLDISSSYDYVDGKVTATFPAKDGMIIVAQDVGQTSYYVESTKNISIGDMYRFYDPVQSSATSDLQTVSFVRKISSR